MQNRLIAVLTACSGLLTTSDLRAQEWPQRPVTLIVSQAAGASPDVMARLIAERLTGQLKVGVVVENKPGGGNVIGAQAAARAAPDGHTFFFATSAALSTNPFLMKALPYDPVKDFAPVALITRSQQVLVVHPSVAATSLAELIAIDKKEPGKLSMAVDGPRNLAGVIGQALNVRAGTRIVPVPYPNINSGLQDTVAGRVGVGIFSVSVSEALIKGGQLRAIAGSSASPIATLPGLPTIASTLPGFDFLGWFMVVAPAATPKDIVVRMNAALQTAAADPKVRELAPKLGFEMSETGLGSPEDAGRFLQSQLALWEKTTKDLGLEPQ